METTQYLAGLIGIIYLSLGLGMFINGNYYKKAMRKMYEDTALIYLAGFLAIAAGYAMVNAHNIWNSMPEILVSLFGWLALVKGIMLFVFPTFVRHFQQVIKPKMFTKIVSPAAIVLGIAFCYIGFGM